MLYKNITQINGKIIKTLINKSSVEHTKIKNLYERYKQTEKGVPILTRKYMIGQEEQKDKINNKVANDFVGEIVDMKVGFFCGVPISVVLDKSKYQQERNVAQKLTDKVKSLFQKDTEVILSSKYDIHLEAINKFNKRNSINDLNLETAKRSTICGYCGRYFHIERENASPVEKAKLIEPWELIFIGDSIEDPIWTIRYFDTTTYDAMGEEVKKSKAEVYSKTDIQYYIKNENNEYVPDPDKTTVKHLWGFNPLIGFANNDEMLGDCNKVLNLIDAYDKMTSDMSSESEQWRLAYMIFKGCTISKEDVQKAKQTGAFGIPEEAEASFLTKDINNAFQEYFLGLLERNIYRFSATPNMNDINFGGNLTGVAMKYKFRPFEDKCKRLELKFEKSFNEQDKRLTYVWKARGIDIDSMDMDYVFTRNYPQNLPEEIKMLRDSKGIISEETRFSLVSFIDDPEKEIEKLQSEEQDNLNNFIMRNEALKDTSTNPDVDQDVNPDESKNAISNQNKEE